MRFPLHIPIAFLAFALSALPTAAQTCPILKTSDRRFFPPSQTGAAIMGPSRRVKRPARHLAVPEGPLESVRISLERTECRGSCPSYVVEIDGDGSATYVGKAFVMIGGQHRFKVSPSDVECLLADFRQADFWALANKYSADFTDGTTYRLSLSIGGQRKTVTDYSGQDVGMPAVVSAIEDEIDRIAANRWVRGDGETLGSLRDEDFDFHSDAAATILANAVDEAPDAVIDGLIAAGAPANGRRSTPYGKGGTAIESASRAGRLEVVKKLIAAGALAGASQAIKDGALFDASSSGNPLVVAEILEFQPNVNTRGWEGKTPLIAMWKRGYGTNKYKTDVAGVARLLLDAGADPNLADENGSTALFSANDADAVRLLLAAGAKTDVRNKYGSTPLLDAETDEAAAALIEAGADTTAKDQFGDNIRRKAVENHFTKTMRLLKGIRAH